MNARAILMSIVCCAALILGAHPAVMGRCAAAQSPEYMVSISGWCPGTLTIEWSGARPNRRQAILFSLHRGQLTIPSGACKGTVLGLGEYMWLFQVIGTRDGSGSMRATTGWPGMCGGFVQLVESGTCRTSNVAGPI